MRMSQNFSASLFEGGDGDQEKGGALQTQTTEGDYDDKKQTLLDTPSTARYTKDGLDSSMRNSTMKGVSQTELEEDPF